MVINEWISNVTSILDIIYHRSQDIHSKLARARAIHIILYRMVVLYIGIMKVCGFSRSRE